MKKIISIVLALSVLFAMSVTASAADVESNGGSGSTPVYLSSTEDGTIGGKPSATAMSVTVPTALPMAMSQNGDVTCADNCKIINNSYGAVRVKSVTITTARLSSAVSQRLPFWDMALTSAYTNRKVKPLHTALTPAAAHSSCCIPSGLTSGVSSWSGVSGMEGVSSLSGHGLQK